MVLRPEYEPLGDPLDSTRTKDTLALGITLKKMVTLGSETSKMVIAFVSFSNTTVVFSGVDAFG